MSSSDPIRLRPPSALTPWGRLRRAFFYNPGNTATTVLLLALALWTLPGLYGWALRDAVWAADESACQAARGIGACWGVVTEWHRAIVFGRYPFDEQWRPLLATLLLFVLLAASCVRACWRWWLPLAWGIGLATFFVLMGGGVAGLTPVETDRWGGLPLTVMLATLGIGAAFPLAVLVALGRRSTLPLISALCVLYVELVRGVPLITVLFMASFMFPLLLPAGLSVDVLLRVLVGLILFAAAYMAEIVRAGLQSVPRGQVEAALAAGMGWWRIQRHVVLPQALAAVVPGLMNNFIGIFKDTSLITIVSLYELTGALGLALNGDPLWRPFKIEGYLFITAIYFACCFAMSRYSLWVERRLARGKTR